MKRINITKKPIGMTFQLVSAAQEQGAFKNAYVKGSPKKGYAIIYGEGEEWD